MVKIKGKSKVKTTPRKKTIVSGDKQEDKSKKQLKVSKLKQVKKTSELLPISSQSQKISGDCFVFPKNKKQLYALHKKWDKILAADGFKDIEFRQDNNEMAERMKKPLRERKTKTVEEAKENQEHIISKMNILSHMRAYAYNGQFWSVADKIIYYLFYVSGLTYSKIIKAIAIIQADSKVNHFMPQFDSDKEIRNSLERSRKLQAIFDPI